MRRRLLFLAMVALLAACNDKPGEAPKASDLLCTVPSRSIAVLHFDKCGNALELLLDSTSVFRKIDLGDLAGAEMVLSYDYSAAMIPLLAISTGKTAPDTSEAVKAVMAQLPELKLNSYFYNDTLVKHSALLISPSQASITEAGSHISAETSILEAPEFTEALKLAKGSAGNIFLRNTSASRWLPKGVLTEFVPRKKLVGFLSNACSWTVASFDSYKTKDVEVSSLHNGQRYFMEALDAQKGAESKLAEVLPDTTDFVVSLTLDDWRKYYDAYQLYLDSNSALTTHQNAVRAAKRATGESPEDWAKSLNIKELARVSWDGREVLLIRPHKLKGEDSQIEPNSQESFASIIFGGAFALQDETSMGTFGPWIVVGNGEDIAEFCTLASRGQNLPSRDLKFAVLTPESSLVGRGSGIKFNSTKP